MYNVNINSKIVVGNSLRIQINMVNLAAAVTVDKDLLLEALALHCLFAIFLFKLMKLCKIQ